MKKYVCCFEDISFFPNFHVDYEHLFQRFYTEAPIFVLLKNISTTSNGVVKYQKSLGTFTK
jgi:hypothetical protein